LSSFWTNKFLKSLLSNGYKTSHMQCLIYRTTNYIVTVMHTTYFGTQHNFSHSRKCITFQHVYINIDMCAQQLFTSELPNFSSVKWPKLSLKRKNSGRFIKPYVKNGTRSISTAWDFCPYWKAISWIDYDSYVYMYRYWLWKHTYHSTTFNLTLNYSLILTYMYARRDQYCRG